MKRLLLLVTVAVIGLVAGAVVTGRPQTIVRDIRAVDIRPATSTVPEITLAPTTVPRPTTTTTTSTTTTSTTTTEPPATTETPATTELPATTEPAATAPPATTRPEAGLASTVPHTAASTAPAPAPTTTLAPLGSLYIMVGNASDTFGLATQTAAALRELGYELVYRADGIRETRESAVYYSDGLENEALRLAESVGLDSSRVQPRSSEPLTNGTQEFQILLFLGNDWYTVSELGTMVDVEPPGEGQSLLQRSPNR